MTFINNIMAKAKASTIKSVTTDKIFMVSVEKLHFEKDFKAVFKQEEDKVNRIAEDMKLHGFDKSQPIIINENFEILDGNSRFMATKIAGIKKVPVIVKQFKSKKEAILYEIHLQKDRRNWSDVSQLIDTYNEVAAMTDDEGNKLFTDVEIAEQLGVSPRQLAKAKEIEQKATDEVKEALKSGEISLHKAYTAMKEELKPEVEMTADQEDITEASEETPVTAEVETPVKPKKTPSVEKLNLKFKPEDFVLLQNAASAANLSVTDYAMNILMGSVQKTETISSKETA